MKKSFSLMEVIIAISILSVVIVALLQIKSDNIFLLAKSEEKVKLNDYISMAINLKEANRRNGKIFLTNKYNFTEDNLRKEFKDIKVKFKDEKFKEISLKNENLTLNVTIFATDYSIKNEIKKKLYSFKLEL